MQFSRVYWLQWCHCLHKHFYKVQAARKERYNIAFNDRVLNAYKQILRTVVCYKKLKCKLDLWLYFTQRVEFASICFVGVVGSLWHVLMA